MSIKEILEILDKIRDSDIYRWWEDYGENIAPFKYFEDLEWRGNISAKQILQVKNKLVKLLFSLSLNEASVLWEQTQGTEYEPFLKEIACSDKLLYKQQFWIRKAFWPNQDFPKEFLDNRIEILRSPFLKCFEPKESDEIMVTLEGVKQLKKLYKIGLVNDEFIAQIFDCWYNQAVDGDVISDSFAELVKQNSDLAILEKIILIWKKFQPERANSRLRRAVLEATSSQTEKNARNALSMLEGEVIENTIDVNW